MHAICIFDFMNFCVINNKVHRVQANNRARVQQVRTSQLYDTLHRLAAAKLGRLVLCRTTCISLGPFTLHTYRTPITILTVQRFDIEHNVYS